MAGELFLLFARRSTLSIYHLLKGSAELIDAHTLRLIDANANRTREGLRTAEDYLRFHGSELRWISRLKAIRHSITKLIKSLFPEVKLAASRLVVQDPLKESVETEEVKRKEETQNDRAVAHRGIKRAQESLRVLEEYLRGPFPAASMLCARHRFELYEAEQWLLVSAEAAAVLAKARVYVLLSASSCRKGLLFTAEAALRGGAKLLQLREKNQPDREYLLQARELYSRCHHAGALLVCNDRVDLALSSGAQAVHLGQEDVSPLEARQICGERLLIGRSTHSVEQARQAVEVEHADYIAIGSMYETETKAKRILAGLLLAEAVAGLKVSIPVYAIGGITLDRVAELKSAGVKRIAVSKAVIGDSDPETATRRLVDAMAD